VLVGGAQALAAGLAAAALWRFDGIARGHLEICVPSGGRSRVPYGTVHRVRDLIPADIDRHTLIPRTSPARTLIDIAPRLTPAQLEEAYDGTCRDGLVRPSFLRWRAEQLGAGRRGPALVLALLDRTEGRGLGDSWLEQEALRLVDAAGLPRPRCQVKLRKRGGGIARVDLVWDDLRVIVELDGHATHATRRKRQADKERRARLELRGWRVLQLTYEDVRERPDYVVGMIRAFLDLGTVLSSG
jgi:hypothetical protein